MFRTIFRNRRTISAKIAMNYAMAGADSAPALLLVQGQTESWWGFESATDIVGGRFPRLCHRFARARGGPAARRDVTRSTGGATISSASSSSRHQAADHRRGSVFGRRFDGGAITYAPPGLLRTAYYEDPPLYSSEDAARLRDNRSGKAVLARMFPSCPPIWATSGRSETGRTSSPPRRRPAQGDAGDGRLRRGAVAKS